MPRPQVDVVVPFRGDLRQRDALRERLTRLGLAPGDTLAIVDNTPGRAPEPAAGAGPATIVLAGDRFSPGYARNQGSAHGSAAWIVFVDADTDPAPDLLARYFDPPPAPETVLMAGGVIDEPVPRDAPPAARYAHLRGTLHQDRSFGMGRFAFAQSANLACRRDAFEAVGGFRETIRSGEDADLSYRLLAAGGRIERREGAGVVHFSRPTVRAMVAQAALHGAGSAWVDRRYPGAFPARRRSGLIWWGVRTAVSGGARFIRTRDRDVLVRAILEPLWELAFEFGRSRSTDIPSDERPGAPGTLRRR